MARRSPLLRNKKYTMMKDFDILASYKPQEYSLFLEANYEKGIQMMTPTYVRDQQGQKFSIWVPIEQFQQFGPGMYLLFLFLKYATILFFALSVISFINFGVLTEGNQLGSGQDNFQIKMASTTLGNVESNQLAVIVVFDFLMTALILAGLIFWKEKQSTLVVECCKQVMLPSYQTVILKEIPELYTQYDMKVFLEERFGEVEDIYTVRDFNNDLFHYKQITSAIKAYQRENALVRLQPERSPISLAKYFLDYQKYYFFMQSINKLSKYPKKFAYITFKSVKSRQQMLKLYRVTLPGMKQQKKQHFLYKGQQLKVKACMMQPNGIKWQNLNLPTKKRVMWITIQICLLILVLLISIMVILILYISQSGLTSTEFAGMSKEEVLAMNSTQALQSFCLSMSITNFNSDPDCKPFSSDYLKYTILFIALPLVIALFKFILTELMKALVMIRRHPYEISKIQSQIVIMFVFYFFATGILQYIVFLQVRFEDGGTFSFVSIMEPIQKALVGYLNIDLSRIKLANDFNRYWYMIASYKIILVGLVSFNVSSFGKIAYSFMRQWACNLYARKQELQCQMNYWLEGEQMEIQFVYAVAATMIGYLLLFGPSIPMIYPFTFLSLLVLFWSTKFIFITFCGKPLLYSHSMNSLVVKILLFCVILHCFIAPLYFGASTIHSEEGIDNFLRIPYFGYYIVLMLVALIYLFYREKLGNFYQKMKHFYSYSTTDESNDNEPKRTKKMSLPSKLCLIESPETTRNKIFSYSMHENPEYESVLKTLYTINKEQRARATCVLNKQLQNLLEKDQNFAADTLAQIEGVNSFRQSLKHPKLFYELLKTVTKNHEKFQKRVGKEYSRSNNPYKFYLKELTEIDKASKVIENDPQIDETITSEGFMSGSLKNFDPQRLQNKNVNLEYLKKIQSLRIKLKARQDLNQIVERSDEQSRSRRVNSLMQDQLEEPTSDARLKSSMMNIGIVSNLGVTSNIGIGGGNFAIAGGGVSNLAMMSKFNPGNRNSGQISEEKLRDSKDMYLIEDRFDCIRETQSIIESNVPKQKQNKKRKGALRNQLGATKFIPAQKDTMTVEQDCKDGVKEQSNIKIRINQCVSEIKEKREDFKQQNSQKIKKARFIASESKLSQSGQSLERSQVMAQPKQDQVQSKKFPSLEREKVYPPPRNQEKIRQQQSSEFEQKSFQLQGQNKLRNNEDKRISNKDNRTSKLKAQLISQKIIIFDSDSNSGSQRSIDENQKATKRKPKRNKTRDKKYSNHRRDTPQY